MGRARKGTRWAAFNAKQPPVQLLWAHEDYLEAVRALRVLQEGVEALVMVPPGAEPGTAGYLYAWRPDLEPPRFALTGLVSPDDLAPFRAATQ